MPWLSVNQTHDALLYAVPMPVLALEVQRGSIPGAPKALEFFVMGFGRSRRFYVHEAQWCL